MPENGAPKVGFYEEGGQVFTVSVSRVMPAPPAYPAGLLLGCRACSEAWG